MESFGILVVLSFIIAAIFYLREEVGIATLLFLSLDFSFLHNLISPESDYLRDRLLYFILYSFFIVIILHNNRGKNKMRMIKTPVILPLVLFLGSILITFILSLIFFSESPGLAFMGLMDMSHYVVFFLVVYSIKNEKQIMLLINISFALAILSAVLCIILSFNPDFPLSQTHIIQKWGFFFYRVIPSGVVLFSVAFLVSISIMPFVKSRFKRLLLLCIILPLFSAIVVTFTRSIWIPITFTIPVLGILLPQRKIWNYYRRLITIAVFIVIASVGISLISSLHIFSYEGIFPTAKRGFLSSFEAFQFTGGLLTKEPSLNDRIIEVKIAFEVIKNNLIAGVGYKYRLDTLEATVSYLHNGYVSILMVQGLIGFIPFMWLIITFFLRSLKIYRNLSESLYKGLVLGFIGGYWFILVVALLGNGLQHGGTTIIALMLIMGLCEVIYRLNKTSDMRDMNSRLAAAL